MGYRYRLAAGLKMTASALNGWKKGLGEPWGDNIQWSMQRCLWQSPGWTRICTHILKLKISQWNNNSAFSLTKSTTTSFHIFPKVDKYACLQGKNIW